MIAVENTRRKIFLPQQDAGLAAVIVVSPKVPILPIFTAIIHVN